MNNKHPFVINTTIRYYFSKQAAFSTAWYHSHLPTEVTVFCLEMRGNWELHGSEGKQIIGLRGCDAWSELCTEYLYAVLRCTLPVAQLAASPVWLFFFFFSNTVSFLKYQTHSYPNMSRLTHRNIMLIRYTVTLRCCSLVPAPLFCIHDIVIAHVFLLMLRVKSWICKNTQTGRAATQTILVYLFQLAQARKYVECKNFSKAIYMCQL